MATGSDIMHDHVCSPCEQDGLNNEATHYCRNCGETFCDKCVNYHNKALRNHDVLGHQEMDRWCTVLQNFHKDHVFTIQSERTVNIQADGNGEICLVNDLCCTPDGKILVADFNNRCLKLLSEDYSVKCEILLPKPFRPTGICHLRRNEYLACAGDCISKRKVIKVIMKGNNDVTLKDEFLVNHWVCSILHNNDRIYISADKGVYVYSMTGTLLNVLCEDISREEIVQKLVLSNKGKNITVCLPGAQTITMDKTGSMVASWSGEDLKQIPGAATHPNDAIFVCGSNSDTHVCKVIQLSSDGKREIGVLLDKYNPTFWPLRMCYNPQSGDLVVGGGSNNVLVFKLG